MQPSEALKVLKTFRAQFSHGMTIDHLFGLVYLKTFNEPSAAACILDISNPGLSLSSAENALRDLSTAPSQSSKVFVTKAHAKKAITPSSLICRPVACPNSTGTASGCTDKEHLLLEMWPLAQHLLQINEWVVVVLVTNTLEDWDGAVDKSRKAFSTELKLNSGLETVDV
jgi:hypothetical protein